MGHLERNLALQAMRSGEPIPDRIQNAPELQDGLELYMTAFFELDCERHHGMGPMPIPFTSIVKYAELFEFDEEQTEALLYFIRSMDRQNITRIAEKQRG